MNLNIHFFSWALILLSFLFLIFYFYKKEKRVKQKEELHQKNLKNLDEQKTNFVSIASHQLRGPLTVIQGYVSMILEGDYGIISEEIKEQLEKIERAGHTMNFLINDYLNVSQIDKKELRPISEDLNIKKLIEDIYNESLPQAEKQGVSIELKSQVDKPIFIKADHSQIYRSISNILDNAVKYSPGGKIEVAILKTESTVCVEIKDTGIGIKERDLDSIFDKFIRSKEAVELNVTGTGLGLFVSKHFIELHDGKISALSEGPGKGATFKIEFPIFK